MSLLAFFPEPNAAAILRTVTEPRIANHLRVSYPKLNEADVFGLVFGKGAGELAGGITVLLARKPQALPPGDRTKSTFSLASLINSLIPVRLVDTPAVKLTL